MNRVRRAELAIAVGGVVVGVCALVAARDLSFTASQGGVLFERTNDMIWGKLIQLNLLGAAVTIALSVLAALGAWSGKRLLVSLAVFGFAACSVQVIAQFGRSDDIFGVRGGTLSLFLALASGLAMLVWADRALESATDS